MLYLNWLHLKKTDSTYSQNDTFIHRLEDQIAANLENEQFGVEQLALLMGFSRSQLHRKLKKTNGKSISQFIREYRLKQALILLQKNGLGASEVAFRVGFGSSSYFSKCFTAYFGYPPSKAKEYESNRVLPLNEGIKTQTEGKYSEKKQYSIIGIALFSGLVLALFFFLNKNKTSGITDSITVLVMPFKNLSNNADNQYIVEGMVDAINRHLSTIEKLNILSFAALDPSKERNVVLKEVGDKYPNAHVLQGSLQHEGNTIRIEVRLLNTVSKRQLWAESYDRKADNLLDIQNDIAKNVTSALKVKLKPQEKIILDKRASYNPLAYDVFLKGWYHHNLHSQDGHEKSMVYFKKALEIDSTLARANLGIALYYMSKAAMWRSEIPHSEAFGLSRPYLEKALELDPYLYEGYAVKSFELLYDKWDFEGADETFEKGLRSTEPVFFGLYRDFLNIERRYEEAYQMAKKVHDKYPYMPNAIMTVPYYYTNRWEEGREYIDFQLQLAPKTNFTLDGIGFFMLNTKDYDGAIEIFKTALANEKTRIPRTLGYLGAAYAKKGDTLKARRLLAELENLKTKTDAGSPAWCSAIINVALGDHHEGLTNLTAAIDDHEMEVPWLVSEPQFYPLHGLPEFNALVKRVGFRSHAYPITKKDF